MTIRIGLIGAGRMGRLHLQSLSALPEARIVAVCDSDRAKAQAAAQPYAATAHINPRTLIEAERLDAVFLCLPPFARGEPEELAARAGVHLFAEPPVGLTPEKARNTQKEIEKSGIVASVGFYWRYLSGVERARDLLNGRKIAMFRAVNLAPAVPAGWRRRRDSCGGQMVMDATDLIDLARLFGGEMHSLFARQSQGIVAARVPDYDIEDVLTAVVRFQSGVVGQFLCSNVSPRRERSLTVVAEDLELRLTEETLEVYEPGKRTLIEHDAPALPTAERAFLEAVASGNDKPVRARYADAVRSLEIAAAAALSAETGKPVNL